MNDENDVPDSKMHMVTFSVGGVSFGADTSQITGMEEYCPGTADDLVWFHELLDFGARPVPYDVPSVILASVGDGPPIRLVINGVEGISPLDVGDISLIPSPVAEYALKSGIWGLKMTRDRLILLVDFQRIKSQRPGFGTGPEADIC